MVRRNGWLPFAIVGVPVAAFLTFELELPAWSAAGAPERHSDHADCALDSACAIADAVSQHFGDEVGIGVGLNSGPVVVGSVGGGGRLEFAVIGDAVNVAARMEGATRQTGDTVLLTEATRCLLERPDDHELAERGLCL